MMGKMAMRWAMAMGVLMLAACEGEGGELKEATERRRAEQDTTGGDSAAKDPGRLPAFVGDSPAPAAADTPAAAVADTAPKQQPLVTGQWTASATEMKRSGPLGTVRGLRLAQNQGFDRLVIDFGQGATIPGWKVEYVDRPVHQCGSGEPTPIAGDGWLAIRITPAQAHDDAGNATVRQREIPLNMAVLREMEIVCDFEGEVEVVLGVATPNPYKVLELENPSRLVIDVQH
jgi:hypothetical protein